MLHFFRQIRKTLMEQNKTSSYLKYAIGEILLVVIGILIALQVNNWNEERKDKELLWGYLQNIRSNIESDIKEVKEINYVYDQIEKGTPSIIELRKKQDMNNSDLQVFGAHYGAVTNISQFKSNKSGFEALKNTGAIAGIQSTHMEVLLNLYYDQTSVVEENMRRSREMTNKGIFLYNSSEWGFTNSDFYETNFDTSHFYTFRSDFRDMLNSAVMETIFFEAYYNNFDDYYTIIHRLGTIIISMLEEDQLYTSEANMRVASLLDIETSDLGFEDIVINGSFPASLSLFIDSNIGQDGVKSTFEEEYITIDFFEGTEWAAAIFVVDSIGIGNQRPSKDFSSFESIELELRSNSPGQEVFLSIKDREDLDDGTETRASIELDSDWKTYEFKLGEFLTADLNSLNAVAILVNLSGKPFRMDIRNIRYVLEGL